MVWNLCWAGRGWIAALESGLKPGQGRGMVKTVLNMDGLLNRGPV